MASIDNKMDNCDLTKLKKKPHRITDEGINSVLYVDQLLSAHVQHNVSVKHKSFIT